MAKKTLADLMAEELGYKDKKELKKRLDTKQSGSVKTRLEAGQGVGEAFAGSSRETAEKFASNFTKRGFKALGKKAYMSYFSGDDIFSAYMRGRLNKRKTDDAGESKPTKDEKEFSPEKIAGTELSYIKIIAKQSMSLPGMARDTNVMRQNLQKLVKIWSNQKDIDDSKGKPYAESADEFFRKEDEKESMLEASRIKPNEKDITVKTVGEEESKEDSGGGDGFMSKAGSFLMKIVKIIAKGLLSAIRFLFNPRFLFTLFSKLFVPLMVIGTIVNGIIAGFKKYQETGSLKEAVIAGLGGMLEFLTFGLFGEKEVRALLDRLSAVFAPIYDKIVSIFKGMKDTFTNMFGSPDVKTPPGQTPMYDEMGNFIGYTYSDTDKQTSSKNVKETKAPTKSDDLLVKDWAYSVYLGKNTIQEVPEKYKTSVIKILEKVPESWKKKKEELDGKTEDNKQKPSETQTPTQKEKVSPTPEKRTDRESAPAAPAPSPVPEKTKIDSVEVNGKEITLPDGVRYNDALKMFEYKNILFKAFDQKDMNTIVNAIDSSKTVTFDGTGEKGKPAKIEFNPNLGTQVFSEIDKTTTDKTAAEKVSLNFGDIPSIGSPSTGGASGAGGSGAGSSSTGGASGAGGSGAGSPSTGGASGAGGSGAEDVDSDESDIDIPSAGLSITSDNISGGSTESPSLDDESDESDFDLSSTDGVTGGPTSSFMPAAETTTPPEKSSSYTDSSNPSPEMDTPTEPTIKNIPGTAISEVSSDIAEGQRMEVTADEGSYINNPTTNNNKQVSSGPQKSSPANVYDADLVSMLARS